MKLIPWYRRITIRTLQQSVVLGIVGGLIVWALGLGGGNLLWCCFAMAAAPLLVDLLRPTYETT